MVFKCQEDSFLTTFTAKVLKCEETKESIVEYGKVLNFDGYEVILENTILFPAGGGQPHDIGWLNDVEVFQVLRRGPEAVHFTNKPLEVGTEVTQKVNWPHDIGWLNDVEVFQVLRRGPEAVHFTNKPLEVGTEVTQKVNWVRRFDHMQQHSGQHLLSALLEKEHTIPTTSWWLGAEESYVELDTTKVSDEIITAVESRCNDLIREAIPVIVKFCNKNDPELDEAHTRGLPKDCVETIRVICIGEIDENMCCGTHVSNLSQLQVIKLLGAEPGKKGKTNLRFLVGNRVTKSLQRMLDRERAMTALLKNEPSKHEELVQKLQKSLRVCNKSLQNVLAELAQYEIDKVKKAVPKPKYVFMFKKEANPDFNRLICKGLEDENIFIFLAAEDPDRPKEGQIMIQGPKEYCDALGNEIVEILKAKGAFKNGKFQGKATELTAAPKCKKLIETFFNGV